jgi:hypothetical protein
MYGTSVYAAPNHTNQEDLQFNRPILFLEEKNTQTMPLRRNPVAKAAVVHHHREEVKKDQAVAHPVAKVAVVREADVDHPVAAAAVVHEHREEVKDDHPVEDHHREKQVKKAAVIHHHRK